MPELFAITIDVAGCYDSREGHGVFEKPGPMRIPTGSFADPKEVPKVSRSVPRRVPDVSFASALPTGGKGWITKSDALRTQGRDPQANGDGGQRIHLSMSERSSDFIIMRT